MDRINLIEIEREAARSCPYFRTGPKAFNLKKPCPSPEAEAIMQRLSRSNKPRTRKNEHHGKAR